MLLLLHGPLLTGFGVFPILCKGGGGIRVIPLGPFDLDRPIGRGGMCEVWRGVHRTQGTPVAIKIILGERRRTLRYLRAFHDEVRSVAGLEHPSIVMVFDIGQIPREVEEQLEGRLRAESPYLVMELADGSLRPYCGKIPWSVLFPIFLSVLDGLAHAHARGVIHRDIKPGNLLLWKRTHQIKLTDFGIAHVMDDEAAVHEDDEILGTLPYMAPEQFLLGWRDVGPWTDLYVFGCTAYALLCGQPPFGRSHDLEVMMDAHLHQSLPLLPLESDFPVGLEEWLDTLLAKDPSDRFQRAADAAWALMKIASQPSVGGEKRTFTQSSETPEFSLVEEQTLYTLEHLTRKGPGHPHATLTSPLPKWPDERAWSSFSDLQAAEDSLTWNTVASQGRSAQQTPHRVEEVGPGSIQDEGRTLTPRASRPPVGKADPSSRVPPVPVSWQPAHRPRSTLLINVGLGLYGLRSIPLVDREDEREELWGALRQVDQEKRARLVLLRGPSGYGKSRLARWLCERAHEVGAATPLHAFYGPSPGPGDGLGPMLSRYLRCMGLSRHDVWKRVMTSMQRSGGMFMDQAHALAEIITPSLEATKPGQSVRFHDPSERYIVVQQLLKRLCGERSVIVWLDDVHWGLEALQFAAHVMSRQDFSPLQVLFVLTVQEEGLAERPIEGTLIEEVLMADPSAIRIDVGPLPAIHRPALVRTLLRLQGDLSRQVEQRTEGNPLFAVQLLENWVQRDLLEAGEGGFHLKAGTPLILPDDLHHVWTARIDRFLEGQSRSSSIALELAAILGQVVERSEWNTVCAMSDVDASFLLVGALLAQGLACCENNNPLGNWSFVHGMLRESLERRVREAKRWESHHGLCAAMLQQVEGPLRPDVHERLARHLLESGAPREALTQLLQGSEASLDSGDLRLAEHLLAQSDAILD